MLVKESASRCACKEKNYAVSDRISAAESLSRRDRNCRWDTVKSKLLGSLRDGRNCHIPDACPVKSSKSGFFPANPGTREW